MCRQGDSPLSLIGACRGGNFPCSRSSVPQVGWLCSPVPLQVAVLIAFTDVVGLNSSSILCRIFQCVKCELTTRDKERIVQHILQRHLKFCQVPYVCEQCRFRACIRHSMINHWHDKHQALEGDPIDEICYGTLDPIPKDDTIFCFDEMFAVQV